MAESFCGLDLDPPGTFVFNRAVNTLRASRLHLGSRRPLPHFPLMTTVGDGGAQPCHISQWTGAVPQRPGVIPLNVIPPFSLTVEVIHTSSSFSSQPPPFFFFRSLNSQNIPSAPFLPFFKPPTSSYLCFSSFLSSFSQFFLPPSLPLKPPNRT